MILNPKQVLQLFHHVKDLALYVWTKKKSSSALLLAVLQCKFPSRAIKCSGHLVTVVGTVEHPCAFVYVCLCICICVFAVVYVYLYNCIMK